MCSRFFYSSSPFFTNIRLCAVRCVLYYVSFLFFFFLFTMRLFVQFPWGSDSANDFIWCVESHFFFFVHVSIKLYLASRANKQAKLFNPKRGKLENIFLVRASCLNVVKLYLSQCSLLWNCVRFYFDFSWYEYCWCKPVRILSYSYIISINLQYQWLIKSAKSRSECIQYF